jgi:isopentenyl-diphosphate Delta-isomerase
MFVRYVMVEERVVLVDLDDNVIGDQEKIAAHKPAQLHRAFSIMVFNSKGEILLQQRAKGKYHCPLIWANTCCSHPRVGEDINDAAHRRLQEEMGFDCELEKGFKFTYYAEFLNGLTEYEIDQTFFGRYDGEFKVNPDEVESAEWKNPGEVLKDTYYNPKKYTAWLKEILHHPEWESIKDKFQ